MEYSFQNKKVISTLNLKSQWFLEVTKMIPPNTTIITKEMKNQVDAEQTVILKELERYNSWFNTILFQFIVELGKLKLVTKKIVQSHPRFEHYKFIPSLDSYLE